MINQTSRDFPIGSVAEVFNLPSPVIVVTGRPRLPSPIIEFDRPVSILPVFQNDPAGGVESFGMARHTVRDGGAVHFKFRTAAEAWEFADKLMSYGIKIIQTRTI